MSPALPRPARGRAAPASPRLAAAALALALACAGPVSSARPLVRVDRPPAPDRPPAAAAAEDAAESLRVADAVRAVAAQERMVCHEGGAELLSCAPGDVGSRTAQVTLVLVRTPGGYEVRARGPFAGRPGVCALQGRLVAAVEAALGGRSAHPDPRSGCAEPGPR